MTSSEEVLRRLTIGDPAFCRAVMTADLDEPPRTLDARSAALLRLGGLITTGSPGPMWQQRVGEAVEAGMTFDEIVGSLIVLAPSVGLERVVAVAPSLAGALGYDVDAALEELDDATAPAARPRPTRGNPATGASPTPIERV
jgi:4-carboxymuconolactone decarboxylase